MKIDPKALAQHWVHAHEEDSASGRVYRPKSFALPPSRGRTAFELGSDGSYVEHGPGPTDRNVQKAGGRWHLSGQELTVIDPAGTERRSKVVELSPDRLMLAKA